jgi:hypothetical protein
MRSVKSYTMHLAAPPHVVFPLLCPVREYEWIEHWKCELVFSHSGLAELDCVFKTDFPDDGPQDVWVVSRYEPPSLLEFVRVNALRTIRYTITLQPEGDQGTRSEWTQVLTGLNEAGDRVIAQHSDEAFVQEKGLLAQMLNHFLATGTRMPAPQG